MTELESKLAEARATLAQVEADIASAAKAQRADKIAQVRALMSEHGITLQDIGGKPGPQAVKLASVKTSRQSVYSNGAGQTWAGRGKRPNWLRAELMRGKVLADFKIAA